MASLSETVLRVAAQVRQKLAKGLAFPGLELLAIARLVVAGELRQALAVLKRAVGPGKAPPAAASAPVPSSDREPEPAPAAGRFVEDKFANAAGSRSYKLFIPGTVNGGALPLVMMLHGCTQDPDDFAAGTRMNDLAQRHGFLAAYPRQPRSANLQKCWNWFSADNQRRDAGEPALIAGIARAVIAAHNGDPARVYVAGISAGGATAAIMASAYPDLFAAAGVHSGLACGAARSLASALTAMAGHAAAAVPAGPGIPTIIFHGDADRTVNIANAGQVAEQAAAGRVLTQQVTQGEAAGMRYTRTLQRDAAGAEIVEEWVLHGAGHAWSGGSPAGSYTQAGGPDASREMVRFFLQHRLEPPRNQAG